MSARFRSGQMKLVPFRVASADVINAGDMVFVYSTLDQIQAAEDITWNSSLATTQADFANVFAGIAYTSSAAGETDDVLVDVSSASVYEYPCASATFKTGAPIGPAKQSGNALESQKVVEATGTSCVGRTVEPKSSATTSIRVSFASAYHAHNTNAVVG